MAKISVVKPFTLNKPDGDKQSFPIGQQTIDDKFAKHWFVVAHTDKGGAVDADEAQAKGEAAAQAQADAKSRALAEAAGMGDSGSKPADNANPAGGTAAKTQDGQ